ncbi:MAG: M56 family metallopeptidase [Terriglobia bacterium]
METIPAAFMNGAIACCPLVLGTWILLRVSRRWLNAATRYSIWWIVMAAVILAPLLYMPGRAKPVAVSSSPPPVRIVPLAMPLSEAAPEVGAVAPAASGGRFQLKSQPGVIVELWAVFSVLTLMRLVLSLALLQRRKSSGIPIAGEADAVVKRCLARCGVRRRVAAVISAETASPMVSGPFKPFLLLPEALLTSLDNDELELVCLHEAAHLARFDDAALLMQRLVQALLVWNPLIHWIGRQMDLEREIACDDFVVGLTSEPKAYASCLAHVAEVARDFPRSPMTAAAMDGRSHLTTRVELLLDQTRRAGSSLLRSRLALFAVLLAAISVASSRSPALFAFAAGRGKPNVPVVVAQVQAPRLSLQPPQVPQAAEPRAALMRVFVSVTDPGNRFVTGLAEGNFNILEGGVRQKIAMFSGQNQRVSMWIVWDVQDSEYDRGLAKLQLELTRLRKTYTPAHPRVRTVQAQIDFLEKAGVLNNSWRDLPNSLQAENPQDTFSLVRVDSSSLVAAASEIRKGAPGRKVVVVVTNRDHQSDLLLPGTDFANAVGDMRVPVYPVAPGDKDGLVAELKHIAITLRNQYVLEYLSGLKAPSAVQVTLNQPRGLPPLSLKSHAVLTSSMPTQ